MREDVEECIKSGAIGLNATMLDRAIKLMHEVEGHEGHFDMEYFIYSGLSSGEVAEPTLTGPYSSRVDRQTACGTVACLGGWLSQCVLNVNLSETSDEYAYRLFIIERKGSAIDPGVRGWVGSTLGFLLFSALWSRVAPTPKAAAHRLMWLKQKDLWYCLDTTYKSNVRLLRSRICSDLWLLSTR